MDHHDKQQKSNLNNWLLWSVVLAVGLAIGYLFFGERQIPASTSFLFFLVLLCPAMMFFMMRGPRDKSGKDDENSEE